MLNTQSNLIKKDKLNIFIEEQAPPPHQNYPSIGPCGAQVCFWESPHLSQCLLTCCALRSRLEVMTAPTSPGNNTLLQKPWCMVVSQAHLRWPGFICPHGQIWTLAISQTPASLFPRSTKLLHQEERGGAGSDIFLFPLGNEEEEWAWKPASMWAHGGSSTAALTTIGQWV